VDQNTGALHDAKRIIGEFAGDRVKFKTVLADLHGGCRFSKKHAPNWSRGGDLARLISGDPRFRGNDGRPFNIIIAANLISEFRDNEERSLFLNSVMKDLLEDGGILIVIEPALRWTTRNLMKVHDELVFSHRSPATGHCIIAPCLHSLPCPMLKESDRDWCHMYLDWKRPAFIADIDRMIGNRKDYLKFSYLIFSNRQNPPQPPFTKGGISHQSLAASHGLYRVVSAPMRSKGKIELLLCNERGLMHLTRLNKDTSPSNADFDKTARGDVVQYGGGPSLGKNDIFKKLVS
jgi:ribosomal protein RSM22 (predicted rRNA methylase)